MDVTIEVVVATFFFAETYFSILGFNETKCCGPCLIFSPSSMNQVGEPIIMHLGCWRANNEDSASFCLWLEQENNAQYIWWSSSRMYTHDLFHYINYPIPFSSFFITAISAFLFSNPFFFSSWAFSFYIYQLSVSQVRIWWEIIISKPCN